MLRQILIAFISFAVLLPDCPGQTARPVEPAMISAATINSEVSDFLDKEVLAHLDEIKSYDPPPAKVFIAHTTGEYTWGNFMYALGSYAHLSGKLTTGSHDLAREVGEIGLLEYRLNC